MTSQTELKRRKRRKWKHEDSLKGKTINYLTFLEPSRYKKGKPYWWCLCVCGRTVEKREDSVVSGDTKSCRCKSGNRRRVGNENGSWKGYEGLPGRYFTQTIRSAKERNLPFNLTKEFMWNLFVRQEMRCWYSNRPLHMTTTSTKEKRKQNNASIDRENSDRLIGYIEENMRWAEKHINFMKRHHSLAYFAELCIDVAKTVLTNPERFPPECYQKAIEELPPIVRTELVKQLDKQPEPPPERSILSWDNFWKVSCSQEKRQSQGTLSAC